MWKEMRLFQGGKKEKQKRNLFLRVAVALLAAYALVQIVDQQITISQKREELASLTEQTEMQQIKNMELREMNELDDEEYIARLAREMLSYAKPDERIFVNVAGN